jgi:hypothetical protein
MVGSNEQSNICVGSGFLPNPVVFLAPCNYACIRVYAEGPMTTGSGLMNNTLNVSGILAAHFPGIPIPATAVDSIAIELRNAATNPTTRMLHPAWLLADGTIRAFTDTSDHYLEFEALPGNYYLVIYHRNHLAIMTSSPVAMMGAAPPAYDFTTAQTQAYGANPMKLVGTTYCMFAGDVNKSNIITASDANDVFGAINATGYLTADANLSGIITSADANMIFGNLNAGSQVPNLSANPLSKKDEKENGIPAQCALYNNYPNPFNPTTMIRFALPKTTLVQLEIYNVIGQRVTTLVNEVREAGYYNVVFDANNIASGVYIYRLQADGFTDVKKMIVLR